MIDDIRESNIIMRGMNLCEKAVRNQPSAQTEIVRCKDCKFKEGSCCDYSAVYVRPNGYCLMRLSGVRIVYIVNMLLMTPGFVQN